MQRSKSTTLRWTSLDDNTKSDLITNTYTTHGLTVTKALAGDWADYTDNFIFTLGITDPDADPGRMASVTVKTTSAAGVTSGAEVKPFTNGKVSFSETIRGGDVIKVTGLPTGAAYTITESGLDAGKYTTAWTLDGETLSTEKTLPTQTVGAADTALTVTNTRSSIAPTGLLLDAAPYGAMLALAAGSGLVFFRKRAVRIDVGPRGAAGTPGHTAGQCAGRAADAGAAGFRRVRALAGRRAAPRGVCGRGALQYKPAAPAADNPTLAGLQTVNPDVCGWLTVDGTGIDYPVVQGATNMDYVNRDVYGDFSLSGAIFLDSRCAADLTDPYTVIYGHHMDNSAMFGDVARFAEADYFAAHPAGCISLPDAAYTIELFACVVTDAYDTAIYTPERYPDDVGALLDYAAAQAVQQRDIGVTAQDRLVALSTCAGSETNGRVVVLGRLCPLKEGDEMQ